MLQYDQMYDRKKLVPRSAKKFKLSMEIRITLYLISVSIPRLYLSIYQDLSWRIKFSLLRDISEKRSIYEREKDIYRTWKSSLNPLLLSPPHPPNLYWSSIYIFCFSVFFCTSKRLNRAGPHFILGPYMTSGKVCGW